MVDAVDVDGHVEGIFDGDGRDDWVDGDCDDWVDVDGHVQRVGDGDGREDWANETCDF